MKKFFTYLFIIAVLISTSSFSQSWEWAQKFGSSGIDEGLNINADKYGNTFIAGSFSGTVNFGSIQLVSNAYDDMFFGKLDSNGTVLWAKQFGGASTDYGGEMIADSLGNYYLLGTFQDTIIVATDTLISAGMKEMLIVKLDSNLNVVWVKRAGGAGVEDPFSIKLDQWGNVYAITPFQGTAYFDADSLVSVGDYDIALVKYDNNGNVLWVKGAGGIGNDVPVSINVDANGNVIMGGHFQDTCKFDTFSVASAGLWDAFITKYDSAGNILWLNNFGASLDDGNTVVRVDNKNNIYMAGVFNNTINIGNISLTSAGNWDIFLAKCDSNGNFIWATQAGSDAIDIVNWGGMTIDPNGNMFVTGYYGDTASFGSITVPGYYDIFVTKYDSTGKCDWVKTATGLGGIQSQVGYGVAESNNSIYVIGSFQNDLTFVSSPLTLSSTGSQHDIYVAKISQVPTGINDIVFTNGVAIYPNPATNVCTITAPNFSNATLILYDITGRELLQQKFNEQTTINVGQLNAGMYVVVLKDKEGRIVKSKLIKE